jgi:hypothetical protein
MAMFFKSELFEIHTSSRNSVNIRNLYKVIIDDELKYLEELSNTSTYKEDTSLKQKLEITIKRLDKLYTSMSNLVCSLNLC